MSEWLEDILDEDNEVYFTVVDLIESTKAYTFFKFGYENGNLISVEYHDGIKLIRNKEEQNIIEFTREVDLPQLYDIPFVYKERIRLYYENKYTIYGYIEYKFSSDTYWTKRGEIFL